MQTHLPLLLVWTGASTHTFSPTGISAHIECERKWAWKYIAKVPEVTKPGTDLGKRTHTVLERYLGEGIRPDFVADRQAAEVASSGTHLLPAPRTAGMTLEQHFSFKSARTGFVYHGFKDVQIAPGVPLPTLGFDGSVPVVLDHKTTKSINSWAKTEADLQENDPQSILYGLDSMARFDSDAADLGWVYYQTEGAKRASPTTTRLHAKHALKVFDVIESIAETAASALSKGLAPLDLPPNPSACKSYGGCPYQSLCNLTTSQKARSRMSNPIIDNLRARVQGTPPPAVTETPSVMGCAPEDVPAPTEIPARFLEPAPNEVRVNPPEGTLPAPPLAAAPVEEPKEKRKRRTKAEMAADEAAAKAITGKDPIGADVHAYTTDAPRAPLPVTDPDTQGQAAADRGVNACEQVVATKSNGFTLYVDCIPIGRPAKSASSLIEKAQERIAKEHGVPDYRLIDFGKGAPFFVAFVDEQVDGTFDLALDTRTPEGAILLETLAAKASLVVRGFR